MARADVDAWFERYENPMKDVVLAMRSIILGADSRMEECIKWQAPTFTYRGNLASFFPKSQQHASLMFHTGAMIPGKHPRLEGTGDTARVMRIGSVAEAHAAQADLEWLVRAWCDWRDTEEANAAPDKGRGEGRIPAKKHAATKKAAAKSRRR